MDKMHGGGGHDRMHGGGGNDKVYGDAGGDMLGGGYDDPHVVSHIQLTAESRDPGKDKFYGGPGEDVIFARDCETSTSETSTEDPACLQAPDTPSRDIIDCGPGSTDFASFDKKKDVKDVVRNCERLKWTNSKKQDGCAFKPWDNAIVKCIGGTNSDDKLVGRDDPDARMLDNMWGKAGDDTLRARRGIDVLAGDAGADTLYGGPGDDGLFGDEGSDKIYGERGDDFIDANDGKKDTISCGGGQGDWVQIDLDPVADEKAPGVPFTKNDLRDPEDIGQHGPPNSVGVPPAGCEIVWEGSEGLSNWFRRAHKK
jgi:Ca2+-binding RTX toxin-like protein